MVEWYTQGNSLLTEAGVHKDWYDDMIKNSKCELRDDTDIPWGTKDSSSDSICRVRRPYSRNIKTSSVGSHEHLGCL